MSGYFLRLLARASAGALEDAPAEPVFDEVADGRVSPLPASDMAHPQQPSVSSTETPNALLRNVTIIEPLQATASPIAKTAAPQRVNDVGHMASRHVHPLGLHQAAALPLSARPANVKPQARPEARRQASVGSAVASSERSSALGSAHEAEHGTKAGRTSPAVPLPAPLLTPSATPRRVTGAAVRTAPVTQTASPPDANPSVHITIGRIELIASPPLAAVPQPAFTPAHAPQSLDAYLAQRARAR